MTGTVHRAASAALMALGVLVFTWGGSQHPPTGEALGQIGTNEYFRTFAERVVAHDAWRATHTGLLAGPLLWVLGAVGLVRELHRSGEREFSTSGMVALSLGGLAWAVVFVLDGFVAPVQAAVITEQGGQAALAMFASTQEIVIRLGLVSWLLLGIGIAGISVSTLVAPATTGRERLVLAPLGVVVGLWPLVAWAVGLFQPGPFTSALWTPTAAATSCWFLAAALVLAVRASRQPVGRPTTEPSLPATGT